MESKEFYTRTAEQLLPTAQLNLLEFALCPLTKVWSAPFCESTFCRSWVLCQRAKATAACSPLPTVNIGRPRVCSVRLEDLEALPIRFKGKWLVAGRASFYDRARKQAEWPGPS